MTAVGDPAVTRSNEKREKWAAIANDANSPPESRQTAAEIVAFLDEVAAPSSVDPSSTRIDASGRRTRFLSGD